MENYGFSSAVLVDDDPDTRHALSDVLKDLGIHNIQEAEDGASAISIISHSKPDIVITDIEMEPVDGLELLGVIRTGKYGLPNHMLVVICSDISDRATVTRCIALGINGFIIKPFGHETASKRLRNLKMVEPLRRSDFYQGVLCGIAADAPSRISTSIMRAIAPATDDSPQIVREEPSTITHSRDEIPFLAWNDRYTVNNSAMDKQHQEIIRLINLAFDIKSGKQPGTKLSDVMQQLLEFSDKHFDAEEELMVRLRYPRLKEHKRLHYRMTEQVHNLMLRVQALERDIGDEVFSFLKDWWLTHTQKVDKEYGNYLRIKKQA